MIQRSQVTFEATLATRTTVSIEKKTAVHLAPPLKALKPNGGSYLECNVEKRMFVYLFFSTIQNIAIDQGAVICLSLIHI